MEATPSSAPAWPTRPTPAAASRSPAPGTTRSAPCRPGGQPILAGGETLVVGAGSYQMGFGAPGSDTCDESGLLRLHHAPHPQRPRSRTIRPASWAPVGTRGCDAPPELWGSGRPWFILNLTDASNVEVGCFEITDHSDCVEGHSGGLACERDNPPLRRLGLRSGY